MDHHNRRMKIKSIILFLIVLISLGASSCKKYKPLKLNKTPYLGIELRTDGYYYYTWDSQGTTRYGITVLYKDGTMLAPSIASDKSTSLIDIDSEISSGNLYRYNSERQLSWGLFKISNDSIQTSKWFPVFLGASRAGLSKGVILNDTTFENTSYQDSHPAGGLPLQVFHFRQFAPKPDSTNGFL
jgi:hypothetical protein